MSEGLLTGDMREMTVRAYGERGRKALGILDEGRVKRYLDFYVVVGRGDEYVVEDNFCTCGDSLFRGCECAHIIAVRISRKLGGYEFYELWYQDTWKL